MSPQLAPPSLICEANPGLNVTQTAPVPSTTDWWRPWIVRQSDTATLLWSATLSLTYLASSLAPAKSICLNVYISVCWRCVWRSEDYFSYHVGCVYIYIHPVKYKYEFKLLGKQKPYHKIYTVYIYYSLYSIWHSVLYFSSHDGTVNDSRLNGIVGNIFCLYVVH